MTQSKSEGTASDCLYYSLPFGQGRKLNRLVKLDALLYKTMEVITQGLVISKVFAN